MNDLLKSIQKQIVTPAVSKIRQSTKGYIAAVYLNEHLCDIYYFDGTGMKRRIKRLALPEMDAGLFVDTPRPGDRVELAYRNQSEAGVYITRVWRRRQDPQLDTVTGGQQLPQSTDLF